jgi:hypothetical protein
LTTWGEDRDLGIVVELIARTAGGDRGEHAVAENAIGAAGGLEKNSLLVDPRWRPS